MSAPAILSRDLTDPAFAPVRDAFVAGFTDDGEDAAALAIYRDGRLVVDLAAGTDVIRGRALPADYLMMVASCSKGITATVLGVLIQDGLIDPEAPVGRYWPEYACNGKEETTVAMAASHRAGLPFPPGGAGLTDADYLDDRRLVEVLQGMSPLWRPGTAMAYHAVTFGTLLGQIILRATGRTVGEQLRTRIAEPLGLRTWLGLPPELDGLVVPGRWAVDPFRLAAESESESPAPAGSYAELWRRAMRSAPPIEPDPAEPGQLRRAYGAGQPAIGAITDAVSLARLYAATLGEVDGVRLFDAGTRDRMTTSVTDDVPALAESGTTGPDIRFGLGYQLASGSMPGLGPASYGHTGAGGRLGLADPDTGIALGYLCSRMQIIPRGGDPRWARLIAAIRSCL